jgi:hypothetical protein
MLTRQSASFASPAPNLDDDDRVRTAAPRVGLRIVRKDEGASIQVQDLLRA